SCHVGVDTPDDLARSAWDFLRADVLATDAYVFSRSVYCWEGLPRERLAVIPPCIDAFAPKNQALEPPTVAAILEAAGVLQGRNGARGDPVFHRLDGGPGRVAGRAEMIHEQ